MKKTLDAYNNLVVVDASVVGFYLLLFEEIENRYFLNNDNQNIYFGTPTGARKLICNVRDVAIPGGSESICRLMNDTLISETINILNLHDWPQPLKDTENAA